MKRFAENFPWLPHPMQGNYSIGNNNNIYYVCQLSHRPEYVISVEYWGLTWHHNPKIMAVWNHITIVNKFRLCGGLYGTNIKVTKTMNCISFDKITAGDKSTYAIFFVRCFFKKKYPPCFWLAIRSNRIGYPHKSQRQHATLLQPIFTEKASYPPGVHDTWKRVWGFLF